MCAVCSESACGSQSRALSRVAFLPHNLAFRSFAGFAPLLGYLGAGASPVLTDRLRLQRVSSAGSLVFIFLFFIASQVERIIIKESTNPVTSLGHQGR